MEFMTNQDVFDKVLAHSRQMTEKSYDDNEISCMYRAENGNKCFVGALIPDELYHPKIEQRGAREAIINLGVNNMFESLGFLTDLQNIHDCHFIEREQKLAEIAKEYNLNYTPPQN